MFGLSSVTYRSKRPFFNPSPMRYRQKSLRGWSFETRWAQHHYSVIATVPCVRTRQRVLTKSRQDTHLSKNASNQSDRIQRQQSVTSHKPAAKRLRTKTDPNVACVNQPCKKRRLRCKKNASETFYDVQVRVRPGPVPYLLLSFLNIFLFYF